MRSEVGQILRSTPAFHFQPLSPEPVWRTKSEPSKLFSSLLPFHHWFLVSLLFPSFHSKPFLFSPKTFLLLSKLFHLHPKPFHLLPKTCPSFSSKGWISRWPKLWCPCQLEFHCQPYGGSASRPCWFLTSKRELVFSSAWFSMIQCHQLWLTKQQCCQWTTLTWRRYSVPPPWRLEWRHQPEHPPKPPPALLLRSKLWPLTVCLPSIGAGTIPTWPNGNPCWFRQMRHRCRCWVGDPPADFWNWRPWSMVLAK